MDICMVFTFIIICIVQQPPCFNNVCNIYKNKFKSMACNILVQLYHFNPCDLCNAYSFAKVQASFLFTLTALLRKSCYICHALNNCRCDYNICEISSNNHVDVILSVTYLVIIVIIMVGFDLLFLIIRGKSPKTLLADILRFAF